MTTATKEDVHEALKTEHLAVSARKNALVQVGAARAELHNAAQAIQQAAADTTAAYEARVRQEPDADKLLADAKKRREKATAAYDDAQAWLDAAERERRSAEARVAQIRQANIRALADHTDRTRVESVLKAGRKLAPLLSEYLELWGAARGRWAELRPATVEYIDQVADKEQEPRIYRDNAAIARDADLPPCPIPAAAVAAVAALAPRPAVFQPDYRPAIFDPGPEVIDVDLRTRTE